MYNISVTLTKCYNINYLIQCKSNFSIIFFKREKLLLTYRLFAAAVTQLKSHDFPGNEFECFESL